MKKRDDGRYQKSITINGKRVFFYGKTIAEVTQKILNYQEKEELGKTFCEVAEEWIDEHEKNIEYTTARRYKQYINHAVEWFADDYIKSISAKDLERFLQHMAAKSFTAKTLKDELSVLKMIFKYATINEYIDNNVALYISPPKGKKSTQRDALTDAEIDIVNNSIDCTFGFLAYFLLYTGLRKGEALALQWNDIDFENKRICVNKSIYFQSNTPSEKSTKTEAGEREVILLDCLAEKLLPMQKKSGYIFSGVDGAAMCNSWYTRRWEKYKKESGLSVTAHQLRHTFATLLFEADINIKDAQSIMGHADISTTQNIYTHIRENRVQETANKLNDFMMSKSSQAADNG